LQYEVDAKRFESNTFTFGVPHSFADRAQADAEIALYPVGRNVQVYFDRSNPATSCLLPGKVPQEFKLLMWVSVGFLVVGVASVVSGIFSRRPKRHLWRALRVCFAVWWSRRQLLAQALKYG